MASAEGPARAHDTHGRRRPFSSWMKRLANLKSLHTDSNQTISRRRVNNSSTVKTKKNGVPQNNPYPSSGMEMQNNGHLSHPAPMSFQQSRQSSLSQGKHSNSISHDSQVNSKSRAPTLATTAETTVSDAAASGAGTSTTAARTEGDRNSTFSSPAHSVRSVTTTLTTVQSAAPPLNNGPNTNTEPNAVFNTSVTPATAIPQHLAPHSNLTTYHSATANNVLTDDASILTLASSSKRRRRNSVDTNASVKALAPASMFGGSRESLPLSLLSGTVIHLGGGDNVSLRDASSSVYPRSTLNAERASLISASGVTAPALASERNSYIGSKYGDGASVRSGLLGTGHGRTDSIAGSIGGGKENKEHRERDGAQGPTSPLAEAEAVSYADENAVIDQTKSNRLSTTWTEQDGDKDGRD